MSANFYELLKYAQTGIASPDMTYYDKLRASTLMGGVGQTLTGIPPLSFEADGSPLISWSMKGNGQQIGTPTPTAPITPDFVGALSDADWTIPITCAGQTAPVYLGQTQTVRRVKKLVLTGTEGGWTMTEQQQTGRRRVYLGGAVSEGDNIGFVCTHYAAASPNTAYPNNGYFSINASGTLIFGIANDGTKDEFMQFLASQYAAGTPVTIWYVLATPETGIVNEPLCKIGDYADELHSEDAGVAIPTVKGQNTLTVDTPIQPSEMTITYKG